MKKINFVIILFFVQIGPLAEAVDRTFYFKGLATKANSSYVRNTMNQSLTCLDRCITIFSQDDKQVVIEFQNQTDRQKMSNLISEGRVKSITIENYGLLGSGTGFTVKANQLKVEETEPDPVDNVKMGAIDTLANVFMWIHEKLMGTGKTSPYGTPANLQVEKPQRQTSPAAISDRTIPGSKIPLRPNDSDSREGQK